ncbi:uncharacterized protein [Dysidea avara]|uniref:uncharacterized protein n=1 Tax=Dysidea avara TaxID=196820 RepID=UPI0033193065
MSCERYRTAAYSSDIRWRIVHQVIGLEKTCRDVATNLNIDPSTVQRTVDRFKQTGDVQKRSYPRGDRKLTDIGMYLILDWVIEKPGIYLGEIKEELLQVAGIDISESRICRYLREWGFTRQKMSLMAIQRSDLLRTEYILDMAVFSNHPEFFVFVDEMGSDKRDQKRKHAYSLRGSTPTVKRFLYRGQHISAIAAITCNGILDFSIHVGGVTADVFDNFLSSVLLPHLQPFDGINPCSVVVMDNAMIHHAGEVVQFIEQAGSVTSLLSATLQS